MKKNKQTDCDGTPDGSLFCDACPTRRFALCTPLDMEQLKTLRSRYFSLTAKQHLYYQGAHVTETYSVCSGWVMLYRILKDGRRQVVKIGLPGDFMGGRVNGSIHQPIRHSVLCLAKSSFCAFPHLTEIATKHSSLAVRIASLLAEDITLKNDYLACIGRRKAIQRVAFLAFDLYQRLKLRGLNRDSTIPFPLTQDDMADAVGLTGVHVNRVLRKLQDRGLLKLKLHKLTILDHEMLQELADLECSSSHYYQLNRIKRK